MNYFVGLDVSLRTAAVCVIDAEGRAVFERSVACEIEDILRFSRAIRLIDAPEMARLSTDNRWAQVTLVLKNGSRIEDAPRTPRGDADQQLSERKFCKSTTIWRARCWARTGPERLQSASCSSTAWTPPVFSSFWACAACRYEPVPAISPRLAGWTAAPASGGRRVFHPSLQRFEVGQQVGQLLFLFHTRKRHLGARQVLLGVRQKTRKMLFIPGIAGFGHGIGIFVPLG